MFIKGLGRETGGQVGVPGLVTAGPVLTLRPEEVRGVTGFPEGCAAGAPERRGDLWSKGAAPASYQGLCRGENTLPCLSSSLQTAADASAWADPAGSGRTETPSVGSAQQGRGGGAGALEGQADGAHSLSLTAQKAGSEQMRTFVQSHS